MPYVYPPGHPYQAPNCVVPDERPQFLPYDSGRPAPQGYYLEERTRRGPVITGALLLGIPYAIGLSAAAGSDFSNQGGWLALPVFGPWLTLATRESCSRDGDGICGDSGVRALLVLDALTQATGAGLLVWGLSSPHRRYVRDDYALRIAPTSVRGGYALSAFGTF